ncbi:DUF3052 domain-containing protein [Gimibacter soli]|uniref:DUF3052 domain-containing protein n=1 Tax=Gimibacter soli TaxID=3024400 RepID=A0AAF0BMN6_9PROT|nr:DUF3052 domain-containing protein [Gimibacter soli]WCL54751.1 DUF3052 domain-containing protein [Gimibacter soli]
MTATAGYSGKPLAAKLGLRSGMRAVFVNPPDHYPALMAPMPQPIEEAGLAAGNADFIHAFYTERAAIQADLPSLIAAIKHDGMIWLSWPKKASKVSTDITEDTIRADVLPKGLVDVKVCAVDAVWSGLKLVIRKELR